MLGTHSITAMRMSLPCCGPCPQTTRDGVRVHWTGVQNPTVWIMVSSSIGRDARIAAIPRSCAPSGSDEWWYQVCYSGTNVRNTVTRGLNPVVDLFLVARGSW